MDEGDGDLNPIAANSNNHENVEAHHDDE